MPKTELREIINKSKYKGNLQKLADELGYCLRTIQFWTSGKTIPCLTDIIALADKLEVPSEQLAQIFIKVSRARVRVRKNNSYRGLYVKQIVVKGLRCCSSKEIKCRQCPYEHYGIGCCTVQLCKDALSIIDEKTQED